MRFLKRQSITGSLTVVMTLTIIQRALALVRQSVFSHLLKPANFGAFGLVVDTILGTPLNVITLGVPSSYTRYVQQYESKNQLRDFFLRTIRATLLLGVLTTLGVVLFAPQVSHAIFGHNDRWVLVVLTALAVLPDALSRHVRAGFAGMRMFQVSSALDFVPVALFSILGVAFVFLLSPSAESAALAQTIASWVNVGLFGWLLWRHVSRLEPVHRPILEPDFTRKIMRFSSWSFFTPLVMHVLTLVDRWMLTRMRTLTDVGIYSTASNISDYVFLFGALTANVLGPNLSRMWEEGRREEAVRNIHLALRVTLLALLGLALFIFAVSPWVIPILCGPEYAQAADLLWAFGIYQLFYSAFYVLGLYPILIERPQMSLFAVIAGLVVNVGLNLWLIPPLGTTGAALAAVFSMVTVVAVLLIQNLLAGFYLDWRSLAVLGLLALPALQSRRLLLVAYPVLIAMVIWTPWVLSNDEKNLIVDRVKRALSGKEQAG